MEASQTSLRNRYHELEEKNKKLESEIQVKETRIQQLKEDNSTNEKLMKEYDEVATAKIHEIEAERDEALKMATSCKIQLQICQSKLGV